ncbi:MAG: glycosyltransferase family A protein [Chthoniobacterales bacterium]
MRLTILLPTHNRADTLEWALRSVAAQTESDFEVLICGDGCTDGTNRVALEWEKKDARFRWFDLPKAPGFGYANRNLVLQQARGEFIGFMAHDDLIFRDHFARMLEPFADPKIQLVASRPLWVDDSGTILPVANNLECSLVQEDFLAGRHRIPATCYLHRRTAFAEVGFWNETLLQRGDLDLWQRIVLHHGPASVRYLTTPGALHFRAIWKTDAQKDPHSFRGWQTLLETPGAFPEILRVRPGANELPQAAVGALLLAENGWESAVRRAAELALDAQAWILQQPRYQPELVELREKVKLLQEECHKLQSSSIALREKLAAQKARAEKWKEKASAPRVRRWPWSKK